MPPKSILKNSTTTVSTTDIPPGRKPANPRHLDVAIHHANILEDRKRVEAAVLDAIIMLMDFPLTPSANAKRPSPSDAQLFIDKLNIFQPADYDALIEERNLTDKCGYALCSNPKQKARSTARKQFIDTDHGVEIVDRKVLEVWCSSDCARRALYVKVQLKEEPAWLRQGGFADKIELMVDNTEEHDNALPLPLKKEEDQSTNAQDDDVSAAWAAQEEAMAELALERGEQPGQFTKANPGLVKEDIMERATSNAPPKPPTLVAQDMDNTTMAIEGHVPRIDRKRNDDDEDEEDAQDWDKHLPG
ncbi:hypothetical protein IAQ61_002091 [Plenodomus lingam]|uniref:RNA polymerase II subunit B1 CTD phosphatase RPAP2 homolog n=1 Tax=Leptosphaeria maculans (strain JN3 / isolate v23.1.3 / race Av1-4-5-6-7-8) TaxID=985895 RepID=E4ZH29_LEPMJ|nr:similar to DUF408 domain protein [Plenodomus lingam JN3]KAH9876731.1 hypothetical protein IAQ61_002091 [Plenodomus lingam]CBX90599.1 similar to DUF408 domain protein [Plenodomus lingam JN3]